MVVLDPIARAKVMRQAKKRAVAAPAAAVSVLPAGKNGGRPSAPLDVGMVERLAGIGCTLDEISAVLRVDPRTLTRRQVRDPEFAAALARGRDNGRATLRRLQWQQADAGNATMLIWLGKQMLGQRDRIETEHGVTKGLEDVLRELAAAERGGG